MTKICLSCKVQVTNQVGTVIFKCPSCGKHDIVRCNTCRKTGTKYICPDCNFSGPN